MTNRQRREVPLRRMAANVAKRVYQELRLAHPTEADIETIVYARKVLVERARLVGVRAQLSRVGRRGVITIDETLSEEQARFAIVHELGHFETHSEQTYIGSCTAQDFIAAYRMSGHESEANAFASEFLMPEALCAKRCDVAKVHWGVVEPLKTEFQVSLTAAAIRFVELCPEAVALVCSAGGKIEWCFRGAEFWGRIDKDRKLDPYSLAWDYFEKGTLPTRAETVSASCWIDGASDNLDLIEHSVSLSSWGRVLSLLWIPPR